MAIDNLAQANAEIEKLWKRLERLERGAPIGFSSISRGALRILSPEGLIVVGSASISGLLTGDGELVWDGSITFTGPFTIDGTTVQNGDYTVNGPWHFVGDGDISGDVTMTGVFDLTGDANLSGTVTITGPLNVSGPLDIGGVTTLRKDLNVVSGGRIVAGNTSFNPNGSLQSTTQLSMVGFAGINLSGTTTISGVCTLASTPVATGAVNVHLTSAGIVQKVGSARRFKIDPVPLAVPHALAKVPVQEWIDLGNAERFAALYTAPRPFTLSEQMEYDSIDLSRIPGVIAEEVEAAGGSHFVTYNEDGVIEGVAYDRLALARTQILAEQVDELRAELAELKKRAA